MLYNRYPIRLLAPILWLLSGVASFGMAAEPSWRAGVARTKITPDGPYWMGGYASRTRPSVGTLQDLYAKAIAIDDPRESTTSKLDCVEMSPKNSRGWEVIPQSVPTDASLPPTMPGTVIPARW